MSILEPEGTNLQRKRRLETLALIMGAIVVCFAYLDSLDGPFIWDDRLLLQQNCIRSLCGLGDYLRLPFWDLGVQASGAGMLYRPLTSFSLALDKSIHGQNAAGFHLTNIAFHLMNMVMLSALARRLGASGLVAAALVTVWGLLPRLAESVAWISGRTDILYATPAIAALLLWKADHRGRRVLAMVVGLLSAFAKEAGINILIGLIFAELLASPPGKRSWRALGPLSLLLGFLLLRHRILFVASADATVPLNLPQRVLTVLEATGRYAKMSLDPWHPKSQMGVVGEPRLGYVAVGVAALAVCCVMLYRIRRSKSSLPVAVGVTGALPMLLVIHLVPMPWTTVAWDRLGYLPWGIAACGLAVAVTKVGSRFRYGVASAMLLAVTLALSLVPGVVKRVHLFSDEIGFFSDMLETTAGTNWGPTISMSGLYQRGGWPERSLAIVESLKQRCPSPYPVNLARGEVKALARLGQYEQAMDILGAEGASPTPELLLMRARLRLSLRDLDGAEADVRASLAKHAAYFEAKQFLHSLERVRQLEGDLSKATSDIERLMAVAQIDMLSGRLSPAEREWQTLLRQASLPQREAGEAIAFICELGSAASVRPSIAAYQMRKDARPDLIAGCTEKLKFSERLDSIWPQVSQILELKNRSRGHCSGYSPFSD